LVLVFGEFHRGGVARRFRLVGKPRRSRRFGRGVLPARADRDLF